MGSVYFVSAYDLYAVVRVVFAFSVMSLVPTVSKAVNMGFSPGDAFFAFLLTEDVVRATLSTEGTMRFEYPTPPKDFGGFAGFNSIQFRNVPKELGRHLDQVYRDHRTHNPKIVAKRLKDDGTFEETEMNPPVAFFYNKDVDFSVQHVGFKYNEDWPDLPASAYDGPGRDSRLGGRVIHFPAIDYQPLVRTFEAVVVDWRDARRYEPLKVQVPKDVAWGKAHEEIQVPVTAEMEDLQIVVTTEEDFEVYFLQLPDVTFYQIRGDGVFVRAWERTEEGVELGTKRLVPTKEEGNSATLRKPTGRYYRTVKKGWKNGDIVLPIWPDCRLPTAREEFEELIRTGPSE